ncbi:hypothetical protein ACIBH1_04350 [Nonomuraea sp. NPDC050663]|uniref:hypothetical protein n=1 Tax=Nonomuraea sp. NPDC050663 TaxID=3364370 RepID=UPI0037AF5EF5
MSPQWDLLFSSGFSARFAGTWIEGGDPESLARILGVDPASRLDCDLPTALQWYRPHGTDDVIWIGEHAPGWTHIISLSGLCIFPGPLSAEGRRLFYVEYDGGEGGLDGLDYWRDGDRAGRSGQHAIDLGELEPLFERHAIDIEAVDDDEDEMDAYLRLLGHVTGRFIDQEWLAATRTLYRIPDSA